MYKNWQYLQRSEIDALLWNQCISNAGNGRVYGLVQFLDHTTQHWDALVYGNYEAVLPLPWKQKFGIRYVYAPFFMQHLGLFGNNVDATLCFESITLATSRFRWIDYNVNHECINTAGISKAKTNYVLDLDRSYQSIASGYSQECISNIQKAVRRGCIFAEHLQVDEVIRLFRAAYGSMHFATGRDYQRFEELMQNPEQFKVHTAGVRESQTNELIFGALIVEFENRLYYVMGAPSKKGRNARATYYFLDQLFQRFAGSKLIFDFEGSDLPGVAAFYQRFGPQEEKYFHLKVNNLPWFLKIFKS